MSSNQDVSETFRIRDNPPVKSSIKMPVSITEVVYQTLREEISHGIFGPGQIHLKRLAERFGVSAVPVREALRRLEAEGLVTFGSNRRITINRLTQTSLNEIFAIRIEIEALAVKHAVKDLSAAPREITMLKKLLLEMDQLESKPGDWQTANERFHKTIYSFSHMPRLEAIIGSLWATSDPYIRLYIRAVHGFRASQEEHKTMLQQIEAGDAEAASGTLRQHLAGTLAVLRGRISEDKDQQALSTPEVSG
jgi:DNA-binding GntR family transcriptional regulator